MDIFLECPSDRNEFSIMNEICITCDTNVPQGKYLTPLPCQGKLNLVI